MRLTLTEEQVERAIRDFLSDPGEEADHVAVRIPDDMPIRVSSARSGGLTVWAGEEAARRRTKSGRNVAPDEQVTGDGRTPDNVPTISEQEVEAAPIYGVPPETLYGEEASGVSE